MGGSSLGVVLVAERSAICQYLNDLRVTAPPYALWYTVSASTKAIREKKRRGKCSAGSSMGEAKNWSKRRGGEPRTDGEAEGATLHEPSEFG